jgi:hypothetical protein
MQVGGGNAFDAAGQGAHLKGPEALKNTEGHANASLVFILLSGFAFAWALLFIVRTPRGFPTASGEAVA